MQKGMNALGYEGSLSDEDFIDILTQGAKHYEEGKAGYRVYDDALVITEVFTILKRIC